MKKDNFIAQMNIDIIKQCNVKKLRKKTYL